MVVLVLLGLVTACGGSSPASSGASFSAPSSSASVSVSSSAAAQSSSAGTPSGVVPRLLGYGALSADWDSSHTLISASPNGNKYDPDSGVFQGFRYASVAVLGGRVLRYQLNFPPNTHIRTNASHSSIKTASDLAEAELPADAKVLWKRRTVDGCTQVEYQSITLGRALAGNDDPDGLVEVSYQYFNSAGQQVASYYYSTDALFEFSVARSPDEGGVCQLIQPDPSTSSSDG